MNGLLLKDLLGMKRYGRTTLLFIAFFATVGLVSGNISFMSSMCSVFCAMLPMTSLSVDEQANWGAYAQCLPYTRSQVVLAKYVLVVLMAGAGFALCMATNALSALWTPVVWGDALTSLGAMLGAMLLMNAISLPVIYRMGTEKARLIIMLAYLAGWAPIMLVAGDVVEALYVLQYAGFGLPALAVVLYPVSYIVSVRIYRAKAL